MTAFLYLSKDLRKIRRDEKHYIGEKIMVYNTAGVYLQYSTLNI